MNQRPLFALLCSLAIAACAALPASSTTLDGQLRLVGNAPHPTVVLDTADQGRWELLGVDAGQQQRWQRQAVRVQGRILRPPPANGPLLPQLQVESITAR